MKKQCSVVPPSLLLDMPVCHPSRCVAIHLPINWTFEVEGDDIDRIRP